MLFDSFLNLLDLGKLKLVEAVKDYFGSNDREPKLREAKFAEINFDAIEGKCKGCGR